jgi:DNA-binding NarL/FixJ family response regulator
MGDPPAHRNDGDIGVLICDDVDAMRTLLGVVIELHAGLRVVGEARDGNEAVAEAARLQPDVILLDLSMPHRTGLEALPDIKQAAPAARVVVLSGFAASTIEADVLALGAERFIEKGADPDLIATTIEEVAAQPLRGHDGSLTLRRRPALPGPQIAESTPDGAHQAAHAGSINDPGEER